MWNKLPTAVYMILKGFSRYKVSFHLAAGIAGRQAIGNYAAPQQTFFKLVNCFNLISTESEAKSKLSNIIWSR